MNCKYVMLNGFLIKDIVNKKYENIIFEKNGFNRWVMKSNSETLGLVDNKTKRFTEELLWQLSFVPKEN